MSWLVIAGRGSILVHTIYDYQRLVSLLDRSGVAYSTLCAAAPFPARHDRKG